MQNFRQSAKTTCKFAASVLYCTVLAGMAEWQTRRTQNPLVAISCGFKSHFRHEKKNASDRFSSIERMRSERFFVARSADVYGIAFRNADYKQVFSDAACAGISKSAESANRYGEEAVIDARYGHGTPLPETEATLIADWNVYIEEQYHTYNQYKC